MKLNFLPEKGGPEDNGDVVGSHLGSVAVLRQLVQELKMEMSQLLG
jgi:hypothetical protein